MEKERNLRLKNEKTKASLIFVAVVAIAYALASQNGPAVLEASRPSGFYEDPFYLELHARKGEIYYTLDGSMPDRNALRYTGPIYIGDASENENVLSARTDLDSFSGQFVESGEGALTVTPKEKVDKATIVRAIYYDTTGLSSSELCLSYFVGFQDKTGYGGIKVVSIVTDPSNLTDYDTGIFVRGRSYDSHVEEWGKIWAPGNYHNKGKVWEREAQFQYFGEDGKLLYDTKCGIRIMGGWHRWTVLRSLNLYARKEYGGAKRFDYDFFGTSLRPHKLTLHSGSNDYYGKAQNMLVSSLTQDLDMGVMHYNICIVFLNGEYWGIYNLTEKYDEEYLVQTYGVQKGDVISVKAGSLENGRMEDFHLYTEAVNFLKHADMSEEENYAKFQRLFDEQSLLDLFGTEIYCARHFDWPNGNIHLWRTISENGDGYSDGRWRYLMYDLDSLGLTSDLIDHDTVLSAMEDCAYFKNLCQNEVFRKKLGANILRIGREYLSRERVDLFIANYTQLMAEPMKTYFRRFFDSDETYFYERMESNQAFFDARLEAMERILATHDMLP